VVRLVTKKCYIRMILAITNGGRVRFMMCQAVMNAELLIKFMTHLMKDAGRKVFLILDNLLIHHCKKSQTVVRETIALFHPPAYSPELNPDKYLLLR